MGMSWIRLPLTACSHTYTQTHPSTYYWALLEAPQILIRSDFWVALDKCSTLNPVLSSLGPRARLITVSVSVCARWALSKQILPPTCFVYCGWRRAARQTARAWHKAAFLSNWIERGCRVSKNSLCEPGSQRSELSRNFTTHRVVGCQWGSGLFYIMHCFATDWIYKMFEAPPKWFQVWTIILYWYVKSSEILYRQETSCRRIWLGFVSILSNLNLG